MSSRDRVLRALARETPDGLEVLLFDDLRTTLEGRGGKLIYRKGNTSAPPSGRMPEGGSFFDTIETL